MTVCMQVSTWVCTCVHVCEWLCQHVYVHVGVRCVLVDMCVCMYSVCCWLIRHFILGFIERLTLWGLGPKVRESLRCGCNG